MNWDAIGAVGEVGGAITVVLTLFYLARQIRDNSTQLQLGAVTNIASLLNDAWSPIYNNERNMKIWVDGLNDPESLTSVDYEIFVLFVLRLMKPFEVLVDHHIQGTLSKEKLDDYVRAFNTHILTKPGGKAWLEKYGSSVNVDTLKLLKEGA